MSNELTYPQGFIDAINNIPTSAPPFAFIHVNYPVGSTCYAESTDGDYLAAQNTDGEYTFILPEPVMDEATWTISCTDGINNDEAEVIIDTYQQMENVKLSLISYTLNHNDWEMISEIAQTGIGDTYWDIGDCKEIILNGAIGDFLTLSNFTTCVYILDFNHPINKTTADNNIIFGGFKSALTNGIDIALCDNGYGDFYYNNTKHFTINHYGDSRDGNTNYGGWKGCDFRYDILGTTSSSPSIYGTTKKTYSNVGYNATAATISTPVGSTLMSALPNDFRNVLRLWTRWVDNNGNASNTDANVTACVDAGISLLTEFEIFGSRSYANNYEQNHQRQMTYYNQGNSKIKYKHNATSTAIRYWASSPWYSDNKHYCQIDAAGVTGAYPTYVAQGLAPAFKV